jgi:hypothetical protein
LASEELYGLLLFASSAQSRRSGPAARVRELAEVFENLVTKALARYVGGDAIRVGHPRRPPVPTAFRDLVPYLGARLREPVRRTVALREATKDLRADVIAWRPFADSRPGQVVVLAQCAIGADWRRKLTECNVDLWGRYIEFFASPCRAFGVPFTVPSQDHWLEYSSDGGIGLDRLRIVELLDGGRAIDGAVRREVRSHYRRLRGAARAGER